MRRADSREELKVELILLCKKEVRVSAQDASWMPPCGGVLARLDLGCAGEILSF